MTRNEDELELMERRMAERIEARVRSRIFATYGTIAAGLLAAFGYFGYDVISTMRTKAIASATTAAEEASLKLIGPQLEKARALADEATTLALRNKVELDAMEELRREAQRRLTPTLTKVTDLSADIDAKVAEMQAKLADADGNVDSFRTRSKDLFLSASYETEIRELAENLRTLSEAVAALQSNLGPVETPVVNVEQSQKTLEMVQSRAPVMSATQPTPVYIQFAGVPRETVQKLSDALRGGPFEVPGEERIATAAGKAEVRYFFAEDADLAELLAEDTNTVLRDMGYAAEVKARFLTLAKGAPRQGVLELWLEPRRLPGTY